IRKIKELSMENEKLRTEVTDARAELTRIRREDLHKSDSVKGTDKKDKAMKLEERLTFREVVSPVAGPSRELESGRSGDCATRVCPVPENKDEVSKHTSNMIENLKESRRKGRVKEKSNLGELDVATREWEPLPQGQPRTPKPRVIANVQLASPCGSGIPNKRKIGSAAKAEVESKDLPIGTKCGTDQDWSATNRKGRRRARLKADSAGSGGNLASTQPKEGDKRSNARGTGP
ncbi:hypothetical protein RF55_25339, partial [Lasius niger]